MKKLKQILIFSFFGLALGLFAFTPKAQAASFDAGRIIDDAIFTNKSAMSVGDIQNFLNSKVPTCDTWHVAGPSAQGATPPWTCLKNYYENTSTGANNLNGQPVPSGAISAAQIIYDAAQTYNINPQVLLVTLQKENGLITDDWPYPWQYRTAMGFACPDNGSCDPAYYGFYKQVNQAARHFRNFYDLNPSWYIPFRPGSNYIQYNPNSGCGGTNVNITNNATAALYSYTPYQPNAAALNNLYGTGDGCSAYGNRNFWRDFNNWFGDTTVPPYRWQYVGQSGQESVVVGQKATWTLQAKNIGSSTWYNSGPNPVMLGTSNSMDRQSNFCTNGWYGCSRPAKLNETSVPPGSIGTFTFTVQAPNSSGNYREYFNLLAEGITWMNDPGLNYNPAVSSGNFGSSLVSNNFPNNLGAGGTASVTIVLKNTGTTYWYNTGKYPVNLGTANPTDRSSQFYTIGWLGANRPDYLTESSVAPGQNGTFTFNIKAPATAGTYSESFSTVAEGWTWFGQVVSSSTIVGSGATPPPPPPPNPNISYLSTNQYLTTNQALVSPNGKYKLILQGDGNLVIYSPNRAIWSTGTSSSGASLLIVQSDGNLVLYSPSRPVWASWTQSTSAKTLFMQDDGNLVYYDSNFRPIWSTGTSGRI